MGRESTSVTLTCGACGNDSVIQIELTLGDGTEVDFFSCHRCEARWWNRDGKALELDAVLDLASKPRAS